MIPDRNRANLYPPFALLLDRFERELKLAALPFYLFEGYRSIDRQTQLYAQGRTAPGDIVTKSKPGLSWHAYGLASDYVLDGMVERPGIQWSWETKGNNATWLRMAEIAQELGLEAGYFWVDPPDCPHVQQRYGLSISQAYNLWRQGGLRAVWAKCDEWLDGMMWP